MNSRKIYRAALIEARNFFAGNSSSRNPVFYVHGRSIRLNTQTSARAGYSIASCLADIADHRREGRYGHARNLIEALA